MSDINETHPRFIVGIGASAGGLEALERLFHNMPAETGLAFVVVQHLSPDFDSLMNELLVRQTDIPVHMVEDGMVVHPNAIYLIPPKKELIISSGKLLLTDKDLSQGLTLPIDQFFRSLAQDQGDRSIGIILSGTGSDGSRGIRDIHEAGGLVIAQSEDSAKFDGMPKSAMETGVVDLVLATEEMATSLVKYEQHPVAGDLVAEAKTTPVDEDDMRKLLRLLRDAYDIDFSLYKPTTVQRRVERRLLLNQSDDFEQYVERVATDTDELNSLYRDLLIGVTQFFRDHEAFALLDTKVLPELLSKIEPTEEVRIWVAGCATGEEAYSLAILVHEHLTRLKRPINAKILATDVHQASLDIAGTGLYDDTSLTAVSKERMQRYFTRHGDKYQVAPELRKMVVFAKHNIIKDPPFTRMDLITCRNMLIYLQPSAQKKTISLFHFGLKTGGVLFLGPSEGVGDVEDEFTPIDRHWKVFRKRRDVRLPTDLRLPPAVTPRLHSGLSRAQLRESDGELSDAYDELLNRFLPPAILIDDHRHIVHLIGKAGCYLKFKSGRAPTDILELLNGDLKTAVSGAIQRAIKQKSAVSYSGVKVESENQSKQIKLGVHPLDGGNACMTHMLLTFDDIEPPPASVESTDDDIDIGEVSRDRIEQLESELRHSEENLQATVEELETSNEELHATNEELVASNEELQSTNEELHSVNEELYSINAEYQRKITELTELTDDMDNLLASTDVGVVFLDKDLCIRKFTPHIAHSFNFVQSDIGRQFDNFTYNLDHPTLLDDVRRVLATGEPFEKEVIDRFDKWHLLRILPYRSTQEVDGVVVTLIDIASLKSTQGKLHEKDRQLQGILDNAPAFIFIKDLQGNYLLANEQAKRILRDESVVGKSDYEFLPQDVADRLEAQDRKVASTGKTVEIEETIVRGKRRHVYLSIKYPLRDTTGRMCAIAGLMTDITRQKKAEQKARRSVQQRDKFLAMLSHELRNPLAAIRNATQLLQRANAAEESLPDEARIGHVCDVLTRQTDQMALLLDDLLDISRITQDKIELRKEIVDLCSPANDAVLSVRSMATSREIKLDVNLPNEPVYVNGDQARLLQLQVNLLTNAVKYTPSGGSIDFTIERQENNAIIRVRDTGVGISPKLQKKIFEPFVQADETLDRAEGGMGVGLTLVRSLAELHSGTVEVRSEGPDKGSEFIVTIPLSHKPAVEDRDSETDDTPSIDTSGLKVLIVEDNDDAREMLRMLLELDGYDVVTASDGLSALTRVEVDQPDAAFIDIGLPELNGYDVAKRIRKDGHDTYLVALTGYGQSGDRRKSRDAGFDEHLTKPVDVDAVKRALANVAMRNVSQD